MVVYRVRNWLLFLAPITYESYLECRMKNLNYKHDFARTQPVRRSINLTPAKKLNNKRLIED
jgi:hypothetical protein